MESTMSDNLFAAVALDQKLTLDYAIPEGWIIEVGMRVEVPLKSSLKKGTVIALKNSRDFPMQSRLLASSAKKPSSPSRFGNWPSGCLPITARPYKKH